MPRRNKRARAPKLRRFPGPSRLVDEASASSSPLAVGEPTTGLRCSAAVGVVDAVRPGVKAVRGSGVVEASATDGGKSIGDGGSDGAEYQSMSFRFDQSRLVILRSAKEPSLAETVD